MSSEEVLMKGNEAIAEAAIRAGCTAYFGYPITPQSEITAYMAKNMLERDRIFIQAESEVAAINMVYGASCAGARAMTSSSSPGVSLKQEGMSYAAGADVPLVLVNVVRGGPGLGSIAPAQSDYFQSTRGGGHGDYRNIVLAPKSVQECADFTYQAFDLADKYRIPVIVLADGLIGQMMEGVLLPPERSLKDLPKRDWTAGHLPERTGKAGGDAVHITSIFLVPEELEARNKVRFARYAEIEKKELRFEAVGYKTACNEFTGEGPDLTLVAYGSSARIAQGAKKLAEKEGIKLGLFRPITLWPFPYQALGKVAATGKPLLTVEMSEGQLVQDVKLSVLEAPEGSKRAAVHLLGHSGGVIPTEEEVFARVKKILEGKA
ncbi:2-oxoglutarate oxidoreductase, alpha subunit [Treponema primitia ZAS-2]|uniref:2-oxoglutarate oxidoreductase, alpha subunit n=1 Tax=Treponema primitia (strain ATCC BAA-887 / DSM 12427 / ZAS-2) TaxID=545694 RepID=F5YJJ6_TREPZ|nr:3-methyl-2-oxobutanoate dehydrogenase subunit VorB [Treponema primitia]AEF85908.1 2-oxoglutarate oxidoreductase, alpha subunit [Treponema primitia ZAS-2]